MSTNFYQIFHPISTSLDFKVITFGEQNSETYTNPEPRTLRAFRTLGKKKIPWSDFASELYRPIDRRLSANLVPTSADIECDIVSVTDPYGSILGFLDRSRYFFPSSS
jgi:hypothetical protein